MIWFRRGVTVLGAGALAIALAACDASSPVTTQAPPPRPEQKAESESALGAYLAARLAQLGNDTKGAADYYGEALKFDADNTDLLQGAFIMSLQEGRMDDAVPLARKLLEYDPDAALPLTVLGVEDAANGDYTAARGHFAAIPKRSINAVLEPLLVAWSLEGTGLTDAALEALSPLSQFDAFKPVHAFHAGLILDTAGRTEAAFDQYAVALSGSSSLRTVEIAGSAYQRLGRFDQARGLYERYAREHPTSMLFNGQALLDQGKSVPQPVTDARGGMAEALFDISQVLRQSNSVQLSLIYDQLTLRLLPNYSLVLMTTGDLLSAQRRFADANALYRSIAKTSPVHALAQLKMAQNLDEMGETAAALTEVDGVLAEHPDNVEIQVTLGDIERRHKQFTAAAQSYGRALTLLPADSADTWTLYFSRGMSFERANDWPAAEADLKEALRLKPDQPDVLNYLGYTWIDRGLHLDEARGMIEKAVTLRPEDGAIVDSLGWALYHLGDFKSAVDKLERAVELKPADSTINEHLGDVYWKLGRVGEARSQWNRAMDLGPEPEQVEELRQKVQTGAMPNPAAATAAPSVPASHP